MTDRPERRRDDSDIRERMARVEPVLQLQSAEIGKLRERVHDLCNSQHELVAAAEDASEARRGIIAKVDALGVKIEAGVLASARAEVSLGATMAAHIEQCKTDKAEQKDMIAKLVGDQGQMHNDNQRRFLRIERAVYIATGALAVLYFLAPHAGEILKALK